MNQKSIKKFNYIICEENSDEFDYFMNFATKNSSLRVKNFPQHLSYKNDEQNSEFEVFKKKFDYINREVDFQKTDSVWVIINLENDNLNGETLNEIKDFLDGELNYHYIINNPCFLIWLFYLENNQNEENLSCKQIEQKLTKNIDYTDKTIIASAIKKVKQINSENLGDGNEIPCPMSSTIDKLMEKILEELL